MEDVIDYSLAKKQDKRIFEKMVWIILPFVAIFIYILIRFALTGGEENIITAEVTSAGVFEIAKDFIRPTINGLDPKFSTDGFEYGKLRDSIYMIRSFVDMKNSQDQEVETKFEITLKYNGGLCTNQDNWEVVKLYKEEQ